MLQEVRMATLISNKFNPRGGGGGNKIIVDDKMIKVQILQEDRKFKDINIYCEYQNV